MALFLSNADVASSNLAGVNLFFCFFGVLDMERGAGKGGKKGGKKGWVGAGGWFAGVLLLDWGW